MYRKEHAYAAEVYEFITTMDPQSLASLREYCGGHPALDVAHVVLGMRPASLSYANLNGIASLCKSLELGGPVINVEELAECMLNDSIPERFAHASKYLLQRAKGLVAVLREERKAGAQEQKKADRAASKALKLANKKPLTEAQALAFARRREENRERKALFAALDMCL